MVLRQYFRDTTDSDDEHEYDEQDFADFHRILIGGEGISNTKGAPKEYDDLEYKSKDGMKCEMGSGYASALGRVAKLTAPKEMEHDTSDPDHDRIDLVVVRFKLDPEDSSFKPHIIKGKPESDPNAPDAKDDEDEYDVKIAEVKIKADKASIDDDDITDKREGNYLPLDNLQRGVLVDEKGIVTQPNQSAVKVVYKTDEDVTKIKDREDTSLPIKTDVDHQDEVDSDKKKFIPKSDGAYIFYAHLAFEEKKLKDTSDVHIKLKVNGEDITTLVARQVAGDKDNIFDGTAIDFLEKDDEVEIVASVKNAPDDLETRNHRIFITKLN